MASPELTQAETTHAYLEKLGGELAATREKKAKTVSLIAKTMEHYHTLCNQEDNILARMDTLLDEYYPVMEPLDGIGTE